LDALTRNGFRASDYRPLLVGWRSRSEQGRFNRTR